MTTEQESGELVPLGDGPMSTVLAGVDERTGQAYALKVLPGRLDRRTRTRVEAELSRLAALRAEAPILVADRVEETDEGHSALRMELCTQALPDLLDSSGPLSFPDAVALGTALAKALAAAHRVGIVHGGVAPGNVLFRPSGEPVLADFGLTLRHAFPADPVRGVHFLPPETVRDGTMDERSDLYGLGAILYLALSGRSPHQGPPGEQPGDQLLRVLTTPVPPLERADLPQAVVDLVGGLLAKDPTDRPADAVTVVERLGAFSGTGTEATFDDFAATRPAPAAAPDPPIGLPRGKPILEFGPGDRRRRLPRPSVLVGTGAVALLTVTAVVFALHRPDELDVVPAPPPITASGAARTPSRPAVQLELAEPTDRGNFVELSWLSSEELDFAIIVAGDEEPINTIVVQRNTRYRVPVDPVRKYCFKIQGANGQGVYESAPKPIRGAVCREHP